MLGSHSIYLLDGKSKYLKMDWDGKYRKISEILNLDTEKDLKAAEILDELIDEVDIEPLANAISGKNVLVFGAGPSLKNDIWNVKSGGLQKEFTIISADGATKALFEGNILPHIVVTDLDGDMDPIIKANKKGAIVVVHAHADNIELLRQHVPGFKNPVGTTQTEETGKIQNFGGFTDGDRCVFLAENFGAEIIVLAGMDFGREIGAYSGMQKIQNPETKLKKLEIGKILLEELAAESSTVILNITENGENLGNIPRISVKNLKTLVSKI